MTGHVCSTQPKTLMKNVLPDLGRESRGAGSSHGPTIELNKILAPVDFSVASRYGLAFAGIVAERFRARLRLLHVVEPPSLPEWGYVHLALREAKLRRAAEERLSELPLECAVDERLIHSSEVRSGAAGFEICQAAAEWSADLIILASHSLSGFPHAFIGSTAERVLRHAPCPVMTVRGLALRKEGSPKSPFDLKRILVTTDFSEESKKAFPYAVALARKFEASLTLLYVVPAHLPADLGQIGIVLEEERLITEARERLPRFREAEMDSHLHVETLVVNGGPAHEICQTAESQAADLIVMGTRGRTGLKHFLLGSVTEKVVRHAPCPVLVVRERQHDFIVTATAIAPTRSLPEKPTTIVRT
jgi:nucleotide-binding universal stress UspA family protein